MISKPFSSRINDDQYYDDHYYYIKTTEKSGSEKTLRISSAEDLVLFNDVFHREWVKNTVIKSPDKIYEILSESGKTMTKHIDLVFVNTKEVKAS